ncbi:MAG: hypothetical protein AAF557_24760 [Pseudomonadota bacterium]
MKLQNPLSNSLVILTTLFTVLNMGSIAQNVVEIKGIYRQAIIEYRDFVKPFIDLVNHLKHWFPSADLTVLEFDICTLGVFLMVLFSITCPKDVEIGSSNNWKYVLRRQFDIFITRILFSLLFFGMAAFGRGVLFALIWHPALFTALPLTLVLSRDDDLEERARNRAKGRSFYSWLIIIIVLVGVFTAVSNGLAA